VNDVAEHPAVSADKGSDVRRVRLAPALVANRSANTLHQVVGNVPDAAARTD
jgi:hypothetical protein